LRSPKRNLKKNLGMCMGVDAESQFNMEAWRFQCRNQSA